MSQETRDQLRDALDKDLWGQLKEYAKPYDAITPVYSQVSFRVEPLTEPIVFALDTLSRELYDQETTTKEDSE